MHTQPPPPPPPPAVHTRLGSHSPREGHNSGSIGERCPLPPPAAEKGEWGRGAAGRGAPGSGCGCRGGPAAGREGASWPESKPPPYPVAGAQGTKGDAPRPRGCWPSPPGAGLSTPRAARLPERLHHCVRRFPTGSAEAGKATQRPPGRPLEVGKGLASLRALGSRRFTSLAQGRGGNASSTQA